jgi:CysZ protein
VGTGTGTISSGAASGTGTGTGTGTISSGAESGTGTGATSSGASAGAASGAGAAAAPSTTVSGRALAEGGSFLGGMGALLRGIGMIAAHPRLWPYAAAPLVIAAFAFAVGFAGGVYLIERLAAGWFEGWTGALWGSIAWVLTLIVEIIVLIIAIVAAKTVILPIAAGPFNEMLSEQVEYVLTGESPPSVPFREALRDALPAAWRGVTTALFGVAVLVLFLPVLLIPVFGVAIYLLPTAYVESLSALDITFSRKRMPLDEKRAWMAARRSSAIGLGAAILLGNLIPLGALVVVPSAAVAGTLLVVGEKRT